MKKTHIILLFLAGCLSCVQNENQTNELLKNRDEISIIYKARRDSILEEQDYGSVYYTQDTTALSYDKLNPKEIDSSIFETQLTPILTEIEKNNKVKRTHFSNELVNTNWCSLYWFNNDFCLYGPADWMENRPILITDSVFYELSSEPDLQIITGYKVRNGTIHEFKLIDYYGNVSFILINIVDNAKGIAIWDYKDDKYITQSKSFMLIASNVKKFPMIISDCGETKCVFEKSTYFDQPNFESINKKGR